MRLGLKGMMHMLRLAVVRCGTVMILMALCNAAAALGQGRAAPPFDIDPWLSSPDTAEFPWTIRVSSQKVDMPPRYRVTITTTIECGRFKDKEIGHDMHFVLKVATSDNHWIPGYHYNHLSIQPGCGSSKPFTSHNAVFLRPGDYNFAIIVYDSVLKQGHVSKKHFKAPPLKWDLDYGLPEVEFNPAPINAGFMPRPDLPLIYADPRTQRRFGPAFMSPGSALGSMKLPVKNKRGVCIDIIVNTSVDYYSGPSSGNFFRSFAIMRLARDLSNLELNKGRVRISIVDASQLKTFCDRKDGGDIEWEQIRKVLPKPDPDKIDAGLLKKQNQVPSFLINKIDQILDDEPCAPEEKASQKIVAIISSEMRFSQNTPIPRFTPRDPGAARLYYFRVPFRYGEQDDLARMLKQGKAQRIDSADGMVTPLDFRKMVATLISDLDKPN
jgi:hypothetical protein